MKMHKKSILKSFLAVGLGTILCTGAMPVYADGGSGSIDSGELQSILERNADLDQDELDTLKLQKEENKVTEKESWEYENNNNLYLADNLPINDYIYGEFNDKSDLDCFRVRIDKPAKLTFKCQADGKTAADFDVALVSDEGDVIQYADVEGSNKDACRTMEVNPALDSVYYVVVLPASEKIVGETYRLDCSHEELEGYVMIEDIDIQKEEIVVKKDSSIMAEYALVPEDATEKAEFMSTDEDIATVDENGNITGIKVGNCEIQVTNPRSTIKKFIKVYVESNVDITEFEFGKNRYMVEKGDQINLKTALGLSDEDYIHIDWSMSKDVGTITEAGIFYGEEKGIAKVTAVYGDFTTSAYIIVGEIEKSIQRRAILLGNADYPGSRNDLAGPPYDVERLESVFNDSDFGDRGDFAEVQTYADFTRADLEKAIADMRPSVGKEDITYFYYSGHGSTDGRTSSICMMNENITVNELKEMLDTLAGVKVVFLDSCFSGGFIGKDIVKNSDLEKFNEDVVEVFGSRAKDLKEGPYKVLTASSKTETSIEFSGNPPYGIFTKLLTDSAGYEGTYPADSDGDGDVSLRESYDHIYSAILAKSSKQHMQIFPENSTFEWLRYQAIRETAVDGIAFEADTKTVKVNEAGEISVVFTPADATNTSVYYYSDDEAIVTVLSDGQYKGLQAGETTVHAISVDGLRIADMKIIVE